MPALYLHLYWLALICIVLNRFGDGLDGALARMTRATDGGGFLDIVLDFIFYASVVLGFALANRTPMGLRQQSCSLALSEQAALFWPLP